MNRFRYLETLSSIINSQLPMDEYNNVMQYYTEYFADAGAEREDEVVAELGSPEELAKRIIAEYRGKSVEELNTEPVKKKGLSIGWIIFIAIIGSPLWLTLFFVALGVLIAVFSVFVSIAAVAVSGILAAVGLVLGGVFLLFSSPATGALVIGSGFALGGVGCACTMLVTLIVSSIVKLIKYLSAKRKAKKGGKQYE